MTFVTTHFVMSTHSVGLTSTSVDDCAHTQLSVQEPSVPASQKALHDVRQAPCICDEGGQEARSVSERPNETRLPHGLPNESHLIYLSGEHHRDLTQMPELVHVLWAV